MKPATGALLQGALGLAATCIACSPSGHKGANEITDERRAMPDGGMPTRPDRADPQDRADGSVDPLTDGAPGDVPQVAVVGAANLPEALSPMDATPSPDGELVYFLATTETEAGQLGAVFVANADGSDTRPLVVGAPLSAPVGIAVSLDGQTLFIADVTATGEGAVLRGPTDATTPEAFSPIASTEGLSPRALSVSRVDDAPWLYFSGQAADTGMPTLYRVGARGDGLEPLASGAPLVAPAGIVAKSDGTVLVIDALADDGHAALLRLRDGELESLVAGLGVGFPAGLTLTLDETTALVSGLSPGTGRDTVYAVDLQRATVTTIDDPVDAFAEPAGLHRAHDRNIFAWADSEAMDTGTVFVLSL